jgi:excisionase family DNA binding protein
MKSTIIESMSVEELKKIIAETVGEVVSRISHPVQEETQYLTRVETTKLLRITLPTLNEYTKEGTIRGYRIGGRVLYKKDEIEASLKEIQTSKYRRQA